MPIYHWVQILHSNESNKSPSAVTPSFVSKHETGVTAKRDLFDSLLCNICITGSVHWTFTVSSLGTLDNCVYHWVYITSASPRLVYV